MTRPIRYFIALALTLATLASAWAGDCRRTAATCVDATPCKNISGYNVCLANIGISCWKYEDTYECVKPDTVDYCAAIAATPGCNVTNSVCQSTAFNGTCLDYKKTYRCGNPITPAAGVVQLENSYTIVYDQVNTAPCASYSSNPSCQLSSKVCIDGPATKNINGLDVYKACWQWKEDYNCIVSNPKDYCEPLKQAGCNKQSEVCTKTAFTGECIEKKFNYICEEEAGDPLPTNVVYLDTTYTIVSDTTNNEMCDAFDNNPNCTLSSSTCIDGPGTKNINGLDVYKDCWQWKKDYSCAATELTSTCQELQNNPNCTETGSVCVDTLPSGACGLLEHQYKCTVSSATTTTQTNCGLQTFCIDGSCFDTGYSPDGDFGLAITNMEAMREAASYGLFVGEEEECHSNMLVNCCKSSGGGEGGRNDVVASTLGTTALKVGAEEVYIWGSRYIFEGLMNSGSSILAEYAMGALGSGALGMTGTFTVWGAQFSVAAEGIAFVGFDPWSLAISIAIYFIMQMMECEDEEQALAMKRGQGLCHKVGSYCASKVLGACVTKKEGWCCFPSKLGRIVNEQGRAQIGKSWGDAEDPDCSGFTAEQLALLKFDEMDLSEFIADIVPSTKTSNYAIDRLTSQAASYYATP